MSYAEAPRPLLDYIKHVLWMSLTRPRQAEAAFGHGEGGEGTFPVSFASATGDRCCL